VVPFGVLTTVVVSHGGALFGTRFCQNDGPPAPSRKRCSMVGRPPMAARIGSRIAW
jgi:hypothetical protein